MFVSTFEDFFLPKMGLFKNIAQAWLGPWWEAQLTLWSSVTKWQSSSCTRISTCVSYCHGIGSYSVWNIYLLQTCFNLCVILSVYWKLVPSEIFTSQVVMVAGLWTFDPDHNWDLRKSPEHLSSSSIWVFWFVDRSWYMSVGKIEAAQVMSVGPAKQESKDSWTWI